MTLNAEKKRAINEQVSDLPIKRSLVSLCKAAADPLRVDIIRVLSQESFGVQELASILNIPQPLMSHHLKVLSTIGLLATRRQGNSIFYRRSLAKNDNELDAFQTTLYATIDAVPLSEEYLRKISTVYKERSNQSKQFFDRNADRFHEKQGMLCEVSQYLPNLKELLDLLSIQKSSRVMEVGPGHGELLDELSRRAAKVVALDNSPEMLTLTQGKLKGKPAKIEFVNSSLEAYPAASPLFDVVVLNMVMHHMPSPARAFHKLGQLVRKGGSVIVAELCSHDQDWVKESCGDVWLGFEPQDLTDWARKAGFKERQSSYLGLKNGFQIQLKLFSKEKDNG